MLALLSLEDDILDTLDLGRRTGEAALLRVAIDVGHRQVVVAVGIERPAVVARRGGRSVEGVGGAVAIGHAVLGV